MRDDVRWWVRWTVKMLAYIGMVGCFLRAGKVGDTWAGTAWLLAAMVFVGVYVRLERPR